MSLPTAPILHDLLRALQRQSDDRLSAYLQRQRWFRSKARRLMHLEVLDVAPVVDQPLLFLVVVRCFYEEADNETYLLPLLLTPAVSSATDDAILIVEYAGQSGHVRDATHDSEAMLQVADGIRDGREWAGIVGTFRCTPTSFASTVSWPTQHAAPLGDEQSNSSILLDRSLVLKLLRKLESGIHPDLEVLSFLTSRQTYSAFPRLVGSIEYHSATFSAAAALLQEFVANQGDGWSYVRGELRHLLEAVRTGEVPQAEPANSRQFVLDQASQLLGNLRELGEITGQLHVTLASDAEGQAFGPEVIGPEDLTAWRAAMEARLDAVFRLVERPSALRTLGLSRTAALELHKACRDRFAGLSVLTQHSVLKIRQHGDYHLGQVLKRPGGEGFVILDFEGEPARSLLERRAKTCVVKDLAGMLRSFSYAAEALAQKDGPLTDAEKAMVSAWEQLASEAFLGGYEHIMRGSHAGLLLPPEGLTDLLRVFQADKAVYELGYELNNRPGWVKIPLHALQSLCGLPHTS